MLSVIRREMRQYFVTPVGYVFLTIFWLLGAAFFFLYNVMAGTSDLNSLFGNLSYLLMLIVPLLTMRLLSDEKRLKTDQLLLSSPTSLGTIVMGKYLAALCVVAIALLGTGVYVAVLGCFARLQPGMTAAYYLGFFLLCACYVAIGLLMSALTESQVTAAVLTFAANMLLQLGEMSAGSVYVPFLPFLPSVLSALALGEHYGKIASGVFRLRDVGYFGVFAGVLLCLTVFVLRRQQLKRR